jgi:hypothetical protein
MMHLVEWTLFKGMRLNEMTVQRMEYHRSNTEFAILTSWRRDKHPNTRESNRMNRDDFEKFKKDVNTAGVSFVEADGVGPETGDDGIVRPSAEPVLIIMNRIGGDINSHMDDFRNFVIELAQKYCQDSIVYSHPETGAELIGTCVPDRSCQHIEGGETIMKWDKFTSAAWDYYLKDKEEKYYTILKGGKRGRPTIMYDPENREPRDVSRAAFHFE